MTWLFCPVLSARRGTAHSSRRLAPLKCLALLPGKLARASCTSRSKRRALRRLGCFAQQYTSSPSIPRLTDTSLYENALSAASFASIICISFSLNDRASLSDIASPVSLSPPRTSKASPAAPGPTRAAPQAPPYIRSRSCSAASSASMPPRIDSSLSAWPSARCTPGLSRSSASPRAEESPGGR